MENKEQVIVFSNLRQSTDTVGLYAEVKAKASKATPFAHSNAKGLVRECSDFEEAGRLGTAAAHRALALLT